MARGRRVKSGMNSYDRRRVGAKLLAKQNGLCALCETGIAFQWQGVTGRELAHLDHIVSPINGGRNTIANLRALCATCNLERRFS